MLVMENFNITKETNVKGSAERTGHFPNLYFDFQTGQHAD